LKSGSNEILIEYYYCHTANCHARLDAVSFPASHSLAVCDGSKWTPKCRFETSVASARNGSGLEFTVSPLGTIVSSPRRARYPRVINVARRTTKIPLCSQP